MDKAKNNGRDGKSGSLGEEAMDLLFRKNFEHMRKLANEGDQGAQAQLRKFLDEHEDIWEQLGNVASHAQGSLVRLISDGDFVVAESIRRKVARMRRELGGAFPTPLELLAAERVTAAWLGLQWVESLCARAEGDVQSATFWIKRQAQAARLYDSAVKALLLMRELLPAEGPPVIGLVDREGAARPAVSNGNGRINGNGIGRVNGNGQAHPGSNGHATNRVAVLTGNGAELEPTTV